MGWDGLGSVGMDLDGMGWISDGLTWIEMD